MAIWDLFHINFSFDYPYTIKIAEFIVIVNIVIFLFILLKYQRDLKSFKKYIFILSLFYLLRALLLPLTINPVLNSESFLKSFDSFKYGLFPSGHTGLMFLLILFQKNKKIKIFNIVSLIFVIILILIGKQHYTIDIIGAIFISYSLNVFYERNIENHDS